MITSFRGERGGRDESGGGKRPRLAGLDRAVSCFLVILLGRSESCNGWKKSFATCSVILTNSGRKGFSFWSRLGEREEVEGLLDPFGFFGLLDKLLLTVWVPIFSKKYFSYRRAFSLYLMEIACL